MDHFTHRKYITNIFDESAAKPAKKIKFDGPKTLK